MPTYRIEIGGKTYRVESDSELSDDQAYQAAVGQDSSDQKEAAAMARQKPLSSDEPDSYLGGFWKGIKEYGKDLVTDPKMMGMVGAGLAAAAVPVTGGASAALIPFLGAAGGAGAAHIGKQLREQRPEDSLDVLGSMALEGGTNAALAQVPGAARWAAPKLAARATRLAEMPLMERHAPAAIAGLVTHNPGVAALVEAAQSPMVNRGAGRVLGAVGEVPEAAGGLARKVFGGGEAEAAPAVERFMANRSRQSTEVPGFSMGDAAPDGWYTPKPVAEPPMPRSMQALTEEALDRYAPSSSGFEKGSVGEAAEPFETSMERYRPSQSGYQAGQGFGDAAEAVQPSVIQDRGQMFDLSRRGGFGSGQTSTAGRRAVGGAMTAPSEQEAFQPGMFTERAIRQNSIDPANFSGARTTGNFEPFDFAGDPIGLNSITPESMKAMGTARNVASDIADPTDSLAALEQASGERVPLPDALRQAIQKVRAVEPAKGGPSSKALTDIVERRKMDVGPPANVSNRRMVELTQRGGSFGPEEEQFARMMSSKGAVSDLEVKMNHDVSSALQGLGYPSRVAKNAAMNATSRAKSVEEAIRIALSDLAAR